MYGFVRNLTVTANTPSYSELSIMSQLGQFSDLPNMSAVFSALFHQQDYADQSDLGLYCLPFYLHLLDALLHCKS